MQNFPQALHVQDHLEREFRGLHVPEVLLSGDHRRIEAWRHEQAVAATRRRATATPTPGLSRRSDP
jgi:tRNA (guanine-N1)-methyltransferase